MNKQILFLLCCSTLLLASCWDERLLKDIQLVYTVGYDEAENGDVEVTSVVPPLDPERIGDVSINIFKTGHTLRDARYQADLNVSEHIDYSKLHLMLLSDEMVKKDIYSYLDVVYRNSRNNLNAKLGIVEGKVSDLLYKELDTQFDISQYYAGIIESSELVSVLPKINLQYACTLMFDPGGDLYLPLIGYNEVMKRAEVKGLALFNEREYTGISLDTVQSTLFNVLSNQTKNLPRFTKKYTENETPEVANYMTIELHKSDVSIKVSDDPSLKTSIKAKLRVIVTEFAPNHLVGKEKIKKIENWWEEELKKDTSELLKIMKEAESDALGLGRRVSALHPERWDEKKWKEQYANIPFEIDFEVELIGTGIID